MAALPLADERFVSLTSFRRSGAPVPTAVWVVLDGDALAVWTPAGSGKVKRLRRDPRVELRPCSRTGKVDDGAPVVHARAEVVADDAALDRVTDLLKDKYGLEFRAVTAVERVASRGGGDRVVLRLFPA